MLNQTVFVKHISNASKVTLLDCIRIGSRERGNAWQGHCIFRNPIHNITIARIFSLMVFHLTKYDPLWFRFHARYTALELIWIWYYHQLSFVRWFQVSFELAITFTHWKIVTFPLIFCILTKLKFTFSPGLSDNGHIQ